MKEEEKARRKAKMVEDARKGGFVDISQGGVAANPALVELARAVGSSCHALRARLSIAF